MAQLSELLARVTVTGGNFGGMSAAVGEGHGTLRSNSFDVRPGDVFICIRGEKYDGHDFICVAAERGAAVMIVERETKYLTEHPETLFIRVEDTRLAAAHMWNELCGRPTDRMCFAAVTGTNGKTSTTWFMKHIFETAGYVTGLIGTVKCFVGDRTESLSDGMSEVNSMTTPPPEQLYPELRRMADAGVELVLLEASSHALAQRRLDPIRFELSIFTNLSRDHLDYHGDMEHYFEAKRRLLELSDMALINTDDEWMRRLTESCPIPFATYSAGGDADFTASSAVQPQKGGIGYSLRFRGDSACYWVRCPIPGDFTVSNTLAAAAAARLFRVSRETVITALADCPQVPGRLERLAIPPERGYEVYIDYAHTPDALEKALLTLEHRVRPDGRLILLFGCGGDRDPSKRPLMGEIAVKLAGLVIVTGDNSRTENPRAIIFDILRGIEDRSRVRVIMNRADAIRFALRAACPGDVVLLAGKGHEDYLIDAEGKHPFSERAIVFGELGSSGGNN